MKKLWLAIALGFLLAGCAGPAPMVPPSPAHPDAPAPVLVTADEGEGLSGLPAVPSIEVPPYQRDATAHEIAIQRVGGGAVRQVEHGFYRGSEVHKFFIEFGGANFRVYVDTGTWEVARFVQHGQVDPDTDPAYYTTIYDMPAENQPPPVITEQQAIELALAHMGEGSAVNREGFLGFEQERQSWFIWVERGEERIQATVDADTGEITRVRHW